MDSLNSNADNIETSEVIIVLAQPSLDAGPPWNGSCRWNLYPKSQNFRKIYPDVFGQFLSESGRRISLFFFCQMPNLTFPCSGNRGAFKNPLVFIKKITGFNDLCRKMGNSHIISQRAMMSILTPLWWGLDFSMLAKIFFCFYKNVSMNLPCQKIVIFWPTENAL